MNAILDELTPSPRYCDSLTNYSRYTTREVAIGDVPLGGDQPIRIQSMTTTDTMDTEATIAQSIRIIEAGADYVRITAPSINEARNLEHIRNGLHKRGYTAPLIADIHFTPNAAEVAAQIVEKVRVNPGNYADRKKFQVIEYTDAEYAAELERIGERFSPLVEICKQHGTAMRIGTNHGSLSDRIMNRFGDTPLGMVESALEFTRICRSLDYHDIVFSMKASNTRVMVQAYRLLVNRMEAEGMNYPIHLGVTEAGDGEDGRIKSAVGIGTLLEDGIGDTVRVSLTEEPEYEIPVCQKLIARYSNRASHPPIPEIGSYPIDPFSYARRSTHPVERIGGDQVPVVIASATDEVFTDPSALMEYGYRYEGELDKWHIADAAVDYLYLGKRELPYEVPGTLHQIVDASAWQVSSRRAETLPLFTLVEYTAAGARSARLNFVSLTLHELTPEVILDLSGDPTTVPILTTVNKHAMPALRRTVAELVAAGLHHPVILRREYAGLDADDVTLHGAIDFGGVLTDGLGDGIWLEADGVSPAAITSISFGILQAARTRVSKTEYISCPSCGRTLFDLQETTAAIRARTNHLKGVKIGIMGCIVNGPGEMADADYGYVGSGPGKISLYRGQEVVKRNIPTEYALEELIELIRGDDNWVEPT